MSGGEGAPKPIRHTLGTVTSAEGTRLSSSNRPDQAAKYGPGGGEGVQVEGRTFLKLHPMVQLIGDLRSYARALGLDDVTIEAVIARERRIVSERGLPDDWERIKAALTSAAATDLVTLTGGGGES